MSQKVSIFLIAMLSPRHCILIFARPSNLPRNDSSVKLSYVYLNFVKHEMTRTEINPSPYKPTTRGLCFVRRLTRS